MASLGHHYPGWKQGLALNSELKKYVVDLWPGGYVRFGKAEGAGAESGLYQFQAIVPPKITVTKLCASAKSTHGLS